MVWEFFGAIRCINLLSRDDRYENAKAIFEARKIPVNFFRTEKHPSDPTRGCWNSHMAIIREAYEQGLQNVLIFEDDIYAIEDPLFTTKLKEGIKFMKENSDWEIFFLGCMPEIVKSKTVRQHNYEHIYQVHALGGHAYVVSRRYMEKIYSMPYIDHAIDGIYAANNHAYAILPSIFYQGNFGTDIQKANLGPIKDFGVKLGEYYSTNSNVPLVYVLFVVLAAIIAILILYIINPKNRWAWLFVVIIAIIIILLILKITDA